MLSIIPKKPLFSRRGQSDKLDVTSHNSPLMRSWPSKIAAQQDGKGDAGITIEKIVEKKQDGTEKSLEQRRASVYNVHA